MTEFCFMSFARHGRQKARDTRRKLTLLREVVVEHGGSLHPKEAVGALTARHGLKLSWK